MMKPSMVWYLLVLLLFNLSCTPKEKESAPVHDTPKNELTNKWGLALAQQTSVACDEAVSTLKMTDCATENLNSYRAIMESYLVDIYIRYSDDAALVENIEQSQNKWVDFKNTHCKSVYALWRHRSEGSLMAISCENDMIEKRTTELWATFLVGADGTAFFPKPVFQ